MNISNNKVVQAKLKSLPKSPGVYLYRNDKNRVIYVGKAINLKNRVSSYFRGDHPTSPQGLRRTSDPKTVELVKHIVDMEWIVTGSEIEALILEAELIKRYKPRYNIDWKDDKNYCYIKITKEDYPKIYIVRQAVDDKGEYLGPYIDAHAVRTSLKALRKAFPFCTCTLTPDKGCLYYHLGLCQGHGEKYISPQDYQTNVRNLVEFLKGKREKVVSDYRRRMKAYSKEKKYELAAEMRDRLSALDKIRFNHVLEDKRELRLDKALTGLQLALDLPRIPQRIECYDISNIFGRAAVGSMVVFENGISKKSDYRRFEIKTVKRIDDFAMHQEVQKRRFKKFLNNPVTLSGMKGPGLDSSLADTSVSLGQAARPQNDGGGADKSFSSIPDLIIIDGGKGQLSSVLEIVKPLNLPTKFVGLAKRYDEIVVMEPLSSSFPASLPASSFAEEGPTPHVIPAKAGIQSKPVAGKGGMDSWLATRNDKDGGNDGVKYEFRTIALEPNSEAFFLVQRIRDEAHRFAITYHRNLRSKELMSSTLDNIPGIGPVTKKKLIRHFGSLEKIKEASSDELASVIGEKLANTILETL